MGVPGFFLWLSREAKKLKCIDQLILKHFDTNDTEESDKNVDCLLIDANCLIHPVCFKVLAEQEEDIPKHRLEEKMINAVIEYTEWIISYVNPQKKIYFAIDGVAPVAKIKQQRYRRFGSVYFRELEDNVRRKHGKPEKKSWNNSAITPGTEFMERLHHKIINWLKKRESKVQVIYSSCKSPSEGEHKLLQYIRDNKKEGIIYSYVIYGLDADLIFLSLAANNPNIFLLREAREFDQKNLKNEMNYVNIDFMKKFIFNILRSMIEHKNMDLKNIDDIEESDDKSNGEVINLKDNQIDNVIKDFIFICYILGNDFIPHLESIDIYNGGIDFLLDKYSDLLISNGFSSFLVVNKKGKDYSFHNINQVLFTELIDIMASEESENLKNAYVSKKRKARCPSDDPFEKEMHKIEFLQFSIDDPVLLGSDESVNWKKRYYLHYFKSLNDKDESVCNNKISEHVNSMVSEYIRGLKWITRYYFDGVPSWNWFYPFDYPPFLEDIRDFLHNNSDFDFKNLKFSFSKPLRPFNQLLMVLPPQSSFLVPKMFQPLMRDKESELVKKGIYPRRFEMDYLNKHKQWMGIPQLPPINLEIVHKQYKIIETEMQNLKDQPTKQGNEVKSILYRNKIFTNFVFN